MAVTTQVTVNPQYILSGGSIPGCIGGGEDYRTLNNNTVTEFLYIRGWAGDNISSACVITEIVVKGCKCKLTSASGGYATSGRSCNVRRSAVVSQGSVSGTNFNRTTGTTLEIEGSYVGMNRNDYAGIVDNTFDYSKANTTYTQANKVYPGVKIDFKSSYHIRGYIKGITLTVTRTRACYIKFKGDGVTEKTTMYDYGTVPSYGSTPTRAGYTFKGWSNGSTTYSGTLPTAYEQDVTYTAAWEKNKIAYTITFNGNGATSGSVSSLSKIVGEDFSLPANGFEKKYSVTLNPNYSGANNATAYSSATFKGWEDHGTITAYNGEVFSASNFDAPFYANTYSDLYNAFKYNKQNLVNHYVGNGRSEGRSCTGNPRGVYPAGATVNSLANEGGSTVLYAQWSAMSAITLPIPTRDGYTFLGWYTARSGGTKVAYGGGSYTPSGNIALYAQWEEIIVPPEIISAAITYSGTQISAENKVPAGEGFLIAVGLNQ